MSTQVGSGCKKESLPLQGKNGEMLGKNDATPGKNLTVRIPPSAVRRLVKAKETEMELIYRGDVYMRSSPHRVETPYKNFPQHCVSARWAKLLELS